MPAPTQAGERRRMVFENVANGVPMDQVRSAFKLSQTEIDKDLRFVARKIREYRFRRRMPPLACDGVHDIRWNRVALLETLAKLGPEYLESDLIIPKIEIQSLSSDRDLKAAAAEVHAKVTESAR